VDPGTIGNLAGHERHDVTRDGRGVMPG
jgi:hypothetical protein